MGPIILTVDSKLTLNFRVRNLKESIQRYIFIFITFIIQGYPLKNGVGEIRLKFISENKIKRKKNVTDNFDCERNTIYSFRKLR